VRPFKIRLSVEWATEDPNWASDEPQALRTSELTLEGMGAYEPDQLLLAVMLTMPELVRGLTDRLTEETGERTLAQQATAHLRDMAAGGDDRAQLLVAKLTELGAPGFATEAPERESITTGVTVPSVAELEEMLARVADKTAGPETAPPRRFTTDASGQTTEDEGYGDDADPERDADNRPLS
jgi:hypothetical protein